MLAFAALGVCFFAHLDTRHREYYRKTGKQTAWRTSVDGFMGAHGRQALGATGTASAAILFLIIGGVVQLRRWGRSAAPRRIDQAVLERLMRADTGRRTFWSRPDVAALLLPASDLPAPEAGGPAYSTRTL